MISMKKALGRIKGNLPKYLRPSRVQRLIDQIPKTFRKRKLSPSTTTYLFCRQMLHQNVAAAELPRIAKLSFTDSAYCQGRQRLPVSYFCKLKNAVASDCFSQVRATARSALWQGRHRVFIPDGTGFSMPDTEELQQTFFQPPEQAQGCGFPVAHLLVQVDARHGFALETVVSPLKTHDMSKAELVHGQLQEGDIVVADRGLCSYAHLALLLRRGTHGLFRMHQRQIVDFTPHRPHAVPGQKGPDVKGLPRSRWVRKLGKEDQIVEYYKPSTRPEWMSKEDYARLPQKIRVREIRFQVRERGRRVKEVTVVTTLLDAKKYPKGKLARLFGLRWRVEGDIKHLKQTLSLDVLRCETVPGVLKEMYVILTIYNLVRRVMSEAADRQGVDPCRISFIDALRWLRYAEPGEEMPKLREVPWRPGRAEPRAKKRRPKQYPHLSQPRQQWKQALE
jgi:hypothetical protein